MPRKALVFQADMPRTISEQKHSEVSRARQQCCTKSQGPKKKKTMQLLQHKRGCHGSLQAVREETSETSRDSRESNRASRGRRRAKRRKRYQRPSKRNSKEIGTFMAKQETQSQERSIALLVAREKTAGGNGCESPTGSQNSQHCEEKTKAKPQNQPTRSRYDPAMRRRTSRKQHSERDKRRSLS